MEEKEGLKEFFTTRDLAESLGWPTSRITEMCRAGLIKAIKVGGRWLILKEEATRVLALDPLDRKIMLVEAAINRSRLVRIVKGKASPREMFWFGLGFGRGRYAIGRLLGLWSYLAFLKAAKFFRRRRYRKERAQAKF